MIVYPNCKINIGLNIERKRFDGYHDISTLFMPINGVCDILEVIFCEKQVEPLIFTQSGLMVEGTFDQNLCVKAYKLMAEKFNIPPVAVHLHKLIPMGAGLGGGSADGAFMIKALNELLGFPLNADEMMAIALELGSDCPFFIQDMPCIGRGRGELLSVFPLNLNGYTLLLVNPGIHVNTGFAYKSSFPKKWDVGIEELLSSDVEKWRYTVVNDFEQAVFAKFPKIADIKAQMYNLGAVYASMSGSGSTVYGLFKNVQPDRSSFDGYYNKLVPL